METLRVFIAIPLPDPLRKELADVQYRLKSRVPHRSVRWVKTTGIHLTLKFLGDTPEDEIPVIQDALRVIARNAPSCTLTAEGLGCFPSPRRPRVLWVGVTEPTGCLKVIYQAVEEAITSLGYDRERHSFTPHLTLGRVRRNTSQEAQAQISEAITGMRVGKLMDFTADRVELIKSDLKPSGAEYTTLESFTLKGGET
jgi:2'-5' RNA ligase